MPDDDRYSRQTALFGVEGQERIEACAVAVVGLGGLGSHVVQQAAFLGVREFALIDDDHVSRSNLNRLIGATEADAAAKRLKVEVAEGSVNSIQEEASVSAVPHRLEHERAASAIAEADAVFGCLDDDLVRLQLTEICARKAKPYFDLATDTEPGPPPHYGGRVLFAAGGERCPSCMGLLDPEELASAGMSEEAQRARDEIYGVDRSELQGTGPAVVSLNGVVASLALMEFMVWVSGMRPPVPLLEYRGTQGKVFAVTDPPAPDCYYCKELWGKG